MDLESRRICCFVLLLFSKTNDKFQFCLTGELFLGIRGDHGIFWAFEDDLGVEMALKITVDSFEINQYL